MRLVAPILLGALLVFGQPFTCLASDRRSPSLYELYEFSKTKRRELTRAALAGDPSAAMALSNYYANRDLNLREKFLLMAMRSGSIEAGKTLVRFYVEPGGIFQPEKALTIRRSIRKRLSQRLEPDDAVWLYGASIDYKYRDGGSARERRARLLRLAIKRGSERAKRELAGLADERGAKIEVSRVPWPPQEGRGRSRSHNAGQ